MMSFTGSARAGTAVTKAAADTIKRVTLELGGKGPNIVFADSDIPKSVKRGAIHCFNNTGQSCNAPTRMLVERSAYDEAVKVAAETAENTKVGDPSEEGHHIGPLASEMQFDKVQRLIQTGVEEGARLVAGGVGRPEGFNRGYFVRPTVFADVDNDMTIAREEIFGPVLTIIPFDGEDDAVEIANDTAYGLTGYVQSGDQTRANKVARKLRSGMVQLNGAMRASGSPFGGYRQSGNGREGGKWGLEDFLEVKAVAGWQPRRLSRFRGAGRPPPYGGRPRGTFTRPSTAVSMLQTRTMRPVRLRLRRRRRPDSARRPARARPTRSP